jgi:hypothetical protein
MMFPRSLRRLTATSRLSAARRASFRLRLESLEGRDVPSASDLFISSTFRSPVAHGAEYSGISGTRPKITLQPSPQTVVVGTPTTFTAAASGTPTPTVQWQEKPLGGKTFTDIPGATSATYSFTPTLADDGTQFRAVFTNTSGTATTKAALFHTLDTNKPWVLAGQVSDVATITSTYPLANYAYGILYNGAFGQIQEVTMTNWDVGTRIATTEPFFTGDTYNTLQLTYVVLLRGLNGLPDNTNWYEYYYFNNGNGGYTTSGGNGMNNTVPIYVRRR